MNARFRNNVFFIGFLAFLAFWICVVHGQYCLPIFLGAGHDALLALDPYLIRNGRPDFFKYGPIWAILMISLTWIYKILGNHFLSWFWCFFNLICFYFGSHAYIRAFGTSDLSGSRLKQLLVFFALIPLALANSFYGQINSVLWLLIALSIIGMRSTSSVRLSFTGGFILALASWMKLFPVLFLLFLFFPVISIPRRCSCFYFLGFLFGLLMGLLLPFFFWGSHTGEVFSSWLTVINRDFHHPHLKIGLAAILPNSLSKYLFVFQVLVFGGILFLSISFDRLSSFRSVEKGKVRSILEGCLAVAILLLSHMTEPPTLALAALPVVLVGFYGSTLELMVLFGLIVVLPSDLVPARFKEILGGQYFIKTYALLWIFIALGRLVVSKCSEKRPSR